VITVTSDGDLSADIDALARRMTAANRAVGDQVAEVAKREQAAGSPIKKLRGMGKGGVSLKVKTKVFAGANTSTIDVSASPAGPWSIAESGRRGGYTVRPRGKRAVTPPKGPSASATVKRSTAGRQAWTKGQAAAEPAIDREIESVFDEAMTTGT
jgi:hypothetical protein